ncbi:hypothetical protein PBY51_023200 [Eleginops maclovinus]|uniref:Uncharacterized protein n=1 Tax=Eleginops maclovinus TaxID=56733 RepID=A0AAN7WZH9_ELEMC|nr:hypothetical protein PBY51_023200 [Eleginops maclovinus]
MERSLAPDQDRRHNVPSSSRTKRCHAELRGITPLKNHSPENRYKEGPKLWGESRYKKHEAPELVVCNARCPDGGRRSTGTRRRQKPTVGAAAIRQQRLCLQLQTI